MTLHVIKIREDYFEKVCTKEKTFEIRKNDRGYKEGDTVHLMEVSSLGVPSGWGVRADISYVTDFEQKKGWVVFSIQDVISFFGEYDEDD